jgi:hypothetical protein
MIALVLYARPALLGMTFLQGLKREWFFGGVPNEMRDGRFWVGEVNLGLGREGGRV